MNEKSPLRRLKGAKNELRGDSKNKKINCIHIHFCYNIDEFHYTSIARGRNGQNGGLRGPRRS